MNKLNVLAVVAGVSLAAGAASATVYDYTGGATNPMGPSLSCDAFGILNTGCAVTYNAAGLGVDGFGFDDIPDTQPGQIDGFPLFSSERLIIDFGSDQIWSSLTLGRWDSNDDLKLIADGGVELDWGPGVGNVIDLGNIVSSKLTVVAYGDLFQGGEFLGDGLGNDSFTVASFETVPLPAAGWMLIAGLGGIAAMKRRKRAA